ncbi:uncharacterized protein MELLADRAFT_112208 [Melampsora larici-populina 98AG31]|uniref:Uncharacterized protein n=1 Tax=Melampsora larici-populina (strain 98AG31 / pathotype 3-4-7) TaxID=747676 RepID=F4S5Q5_MELLP|nr:uncharacterized protein MELLADRAFT_112208 [Melampsora larici-populina 98AG31]EGF99938.1 hypothetical protein MELLADRAFT_112208 [Melampsora larici-populina 98AG31]
MSKHMWVVEVCTFQIVSVSNTQHFTRHVSLAQITGVSVTSGPSAGGAVSTPMSGETIITPGGRARGKMIFNDKPTIQGSSKDLDGNLAAEEKPKTPAKKRPRATPVRNVVKPANKRAKKPVAQSPHAPSTILEPVNCEEDSAIPHQNKGKGKGKSVVDSVGEEQSVGEEDSDED